MKTAKVFGNDSDRLINAIDIRNGLESRFQQFVDPEYEFKVIYVNYSKNHGDPYFRLYLSHEDYLKLTPERKTRFDILKGMDHFTETQWHKDWEIAVSHFAVNEKYIKNPTTGKYKRADAFYKDGNVVIEFQHSYTNLEFVFKNNFYSELGIRTIWLFDLNKASVKETGCYVELLEDNANGFFRVAEENGDLSNYFVFIQVKGGLIYRVLKLERKTIDSQLKSTIRFFEKDKVYTKEEFVNAIKNKESSFFEKEVHNKCKTLFEIWRETNDGVRRQIIVKNTITNGVIKVFKDKNTGMMSENFQNGCIGYQYCTYDCKKKKYIVTSPNKFYSLPKSKAKLKIWELVDKK